jgi:hypothetical protein
VATWPLVRSAAILEGLSNAANEETKRNRATQRAGSPCRGSRNALLGLICLKELRRFIAED